MLCKYLATVDHELLGHVDGRDGVLGPLVLQAAHLAVDVLVGVEAEEAAVVRQGDEVQAGHAGPQTVLQCGGGDNKWWQSAYHQEHTASTSALSAAFPTF